MAADSDSPAPVATKTVRLTMGAFVLIGGIAFVVGAAGGHPGRAWQAYLVNFLLWSGMASGAVLFSAIMHVTGARWSDRMAGIAEAFSAFFPLSFLLFLGLFFGKAHVFAWLHHDLHGKEVWLNIPFLFSRDCLGLLILYGLGFVFLYDSLRLRYGSQAPAGGFRKGLHRRWAAGEKDAAVIRSRMVRVGFFYCLSFAVVLSLLGYDLVMALDPHWISTLFGAYSFVKAVYLGLGGLIIVASILYLKNGEETGLESKHFHDVGKLFFAFCLVWGDFFYAQFVVIWYGNIPEETAYVIERTMASPWNVAAWTVLIVCFVLPFLILLNRKIKTAPRAMIVLCSVILLGMWLEHLLLVGPALSHGAATLPLGITELLITLGFLGLMASALIFFINLFPEVALAPERNRP
jgi:hypothetical protein